MLGISFLVLMVLSLVAMAPGPPAALRGGMDLFSAMFYVFIALLALTLASYLVTLPILPVMGPLVHRGWMRRAAAGLPIHGSPRAPREKWDWACRCSR